MKPPTLCTRDFERSDKCVHRHGLGHTYAAHPAHEDALVHAIRPALGHASLATTSAHLDTIAPSELLALVRRLHDKASHEPHEAPEPTIDTQTVETLRRQIAELHEQLNAITG